jgi:pSer/pThr/pTyr-binding forkhead associated (FHA) protein
MPSADPPPSTAPITPIAPVAPTRELDALPRLDARTRRRSLAVETAPPGRYLLVEDGAERRLLPLAAQTTSIGRGVSADVIVSDHTVSRRHALIVRRGSATRVLDDRSTNGTWVNGRRVTEADLADGDVIVLGRVVVTFSVVPERVPGTAA